MKKPGKGPAEAQSMLTHWREAVPNDRLAHLVKDVARAFIRALQVRLAQHGVSFGHWTFLRVLWESDGLTQRELSDQAGVMEPTTFAALKAMEKLGYVVRAQRPDNKRKVYIHLTPKGRLLKSKLVPLAEEVNNISVCGIKESAVAMTRMTLLTMLENLARDEIESAYTSRRIPVTQRHLDESQAKLARRRSG